MIATRFPLSRLASLAPWFAIGGAGLLLWGGGLRAISQTGSDLPPLLEFAREASLRVLPALTAPHSAPALFPVAEQWTAAGTRLTGQWDARLFAEANLLLAVVALVLFLHGVWRNFSARALAGVASVTLVFLTLAPVFPRATGSAALASSWTILLLLQLQLSAPGRGAVARACGSVLGLAHLALSALGLAAAFAVFIRDLRMAERRRHAWLSGAVCVAGLGWLVLRSGGAFPEDDSTLLDALAWPLSGAIGFACLWAPAVFATVRWIMRPSQADHRLAWVGALALAGVGGTLLLAAVGQQPPREWSLVALLINTVSLATLPRAGHSWHRPGVVAAALWLIATTAGVANLPRLTLHERAGPRPESPLAASLRNLAARRAADWPSDGAPDAATRAALADSLRHPALVNALPPSVRPPSAVRARTLGGFTAEIPAALPSPDGLPAWRCFPAPGQGEFVSEPLTSSTALVQIRVAGTLRPPATELVLIAADGRETPPLETGFTSDTKWKRVNFAAPSGPFRIVARDRSAEHWLAFTAPQEIDRASWLAVKLARSSLAWTIAGAVLVLLASVAAWPALVRTRVAEIDWRLAPVLALAAYTVFFLPRVDNTAGPNDAGGYVNFAKTVSSGKLADDIRVLPGIAGAEDPELYLPTTGRLAPDGKMAPEYPPGLGLQMAALTLFMPLSAATQLALFTNLLLGVVMTWRTARAFHLPDAWAWLAAGIVALSPVYLFQGLQPQSDAAALAWVTGAVGFAWTAREKPWHAAIAGAFVAMAVLLRPANVLCLVPVLVCLFDRPRQLRWLVLAGLPAAVWTLWFNHRMFGHALSTGYGDVSGWWGVKFIPPTLLSYAQWLPVMFTPVILAAPAAPWFGEFAPRARLVLGLWAGAFLGFYVCYWCTYDNWYNMRFVLPAAPALLVLGLHVCRGALARRWNLFPHAVTARELVPTVLLVALLLGIVVADTVRRDVLMWVGASRAHRVAVDWLRGRAPAGSVVIARHAANSVWHYTDFTLLRADHPALRREDFLPTVAASGRPIYSINQHWERRGFEWGHGRGDGLPDLPGKWERRAVLWDGEYVVWRWHPSTAEAAR